MFEISSDLMDLAQRLVFHAYPELSQAKISIRYDNVLSYAYVRWSGRGDIQVTCNFNSEGWPEPAILGLISHELSHPAQTRDWHSKSRPTTTCFHGD